MKRSNRAWLVGAIFVVAWTLLGVFTPIAQVPAWVPKVGLGLSTFAPAAFVLAYTMLGLVSPNKWWQNDVGTNIVWLMIADVIDHGTITWAVFFHHGDLSNDWAAWAYIGCQFAAALIVIWRGLIFGRAEIWRRRGNGHGAPAK